MQKELTARTASLLRSAAGKVPGLTAVVGLDAFVDEIVRVVGKRISATSYKPIEQLAELGTRIVDAAGQSTNLELVVERVKLGGNGPIMANALAALGPAVTCIGPLGDPDLHPAFAEIAQRAKVITLGQPAHTDALEFGDGKLMMGKLEPLNDVTWDRMLERMGEEALKQAFCRSSLVALVNWTMIPAMSAIWKEILTLIEAEPSPDRLYFFDLADPEKHDHGAIADACQLAARFSQHSRTILGLNEKEAFLVGECMGYSGGRSSRADVGAVAKFISSRVDVEAVVVHPRAYAVVASGGNLHADVDGPFTDRPLISTGAGDHFNAGFCLGKLLGLGDQESVAAAVGTSGYYVRNAASPSLEQLAAFLEQQSILSSETTATA